MVVSNVLQHIKKTRTTHCTGFESTYIEEKPKRQVVACHPGSKAQTRQQKNKK